MVNPFSKMNYHLKNYLEIIYEVFGFNIMFVANRKTNDETDLFDDC